MAVKSVRLSVGSIFPKGPGKIYFYRYQFDGHRKTVSLQTANRAEALRKAEEFIPIIKAASAEIVAAHVQQAKGFATGKLFTAENGTENYLSCTEALYPYGRGIKFNSPFLCKKNTFVTA